MPSLQRLELLELKRIIRQCSPASKEELAGPQAHEDEPSGKTEEQYTREHDNGQHIELQLHLLRG